LQPLSDCGLIRLPVYRHDLPCSRGFRLDTAKHVPPTDCRFYDHAKGQSERERQDLAAHDCRYRSAALSA
jgi:glycosidase